MVFVDGKNDIDMFELADESYAVQNAHEDLKKCATEIILSNDEDGVAKWFENHIKIDNTNLAPDEVADMVIEKFGLVANEKDEREYRFGV